MNVKSHILIVLLLLTATSLAGSGTDTAKPQQVDSRADEFPNPADDAISAYVRRIFQDSRGNLWIGLGIEGVARYDGDSLSPARKR